MGERLTARFDLPVAYDVVFTRRVFSGDNPDLARSLEPRAAGAPPRALFVLDDGLMDARPGFLGEIRAWADAHGVELAGEPLVIPGGETCKNNPRWVERLRDAIAERGVCRRSYVVAVGGGAVLDCAGYAAATAHRGVRHVRVPTTTLSQADSAVGVKNGVNAAGVKNFLGCFSPPDAVVVDPDLLATLTDRDWRAGVAEAVKVALLKDPAFFEWIEANAGRLAGRDLGAMERLIRRSAALHLSHIAEGGDPFERGASRPLDFGHWAAHRLETLSGFGLNHGEAVAVGLVLDLAYSVRAGMLDEAVAERVWATLDAVGFTLDSPLLTDGAGGLHPGLLRGLDDFREHLGGELTIMLLSEIGRGVEVHAMDPGLIEAAAGALRARAAGVPA
ncbi:MAG: 3-dehydroquinate synthase [Planctomycetota bacterium]|nr:MAG: 3-dehydroquinate synthase [Planctomycetota bacterium]